MKIFVPRLTLDLKNSIKDCILSVVYRKKDVIDFFKNNSCSSSDLACIDLSTMSRSDIVDNVLNQLVQRPDRGIRQIHSVLDQLVEWSDFDTYWFANGTLSAGKAKSKIDKLKQLVGKKTDREEEKNKLKEKLQLEKNKELKIQHLAQLRSIFFDMCKSLDDASQKRGYDLQDFIQRLFVHFDIEVTAPFAINGEQIDGSFKFDGDNYIFEAKWHDKFTSSNDLYTFVTKVDGKALYARGVFFSINGYTDNAIDVLHRGKVQKTILFNSQDFIAILEEQISLRDLLDRKIKAAQTKGEIFVTAGNLI